MFKNSLDKICIYVKIDVSRLCCVCCAIHMANNYIRYLYYTKINKKINCRFVNFLLSYFLLSRPQNNFHHFENWKNLQKMRAVNKSKCLYKIFNYMNIHTYILATTVLMAAYISITNFQRLMLVT